jgi:RHS repeat-associated protein
MKGLTHMKTAFACVAALVLQAVMAVAASAAPPELPPPGMAKYLVVLWEAGTPLPGEQATGRKASGKEPDFAKMGGRVLFTRANRRVIFLSRGQAHSLRRHESVAYIQRIWVGESLADWTDPDPPNHSRFAVEADVANLTWGPVAYQYDSAGNVKSAGSDSYTYDSAGRLIQAVVGGKTESYEYDSFGNMTKKGITGVTPVTIPVDGASNRLIGPAYDAAGNLIATGERESYTYDSLGMMATSDRPSSERRYIYDVNDERIGRIHDQYLSRWTIRDLDGRVLREFKSDDTVSESYWYWEQDYVYAGGELVGGETQEWSFEDVQTYGGRRHYHLDHLGSPRMVTNDARASIMFHNYYPFGVEQTPAWQEQLNPGDPHVDDARFTGHERDFHGALNFENADYLDYMHARYYDPNKGRFMSVDPTWESADIGKPQSWNRYAYVTNNPIRYTDPDGKVGIDPILAKELAMAAYATGAEFVTTYVLDADSMGNGELPKDPAERVRYIEQHAKNASGGTGSSDEMLTRRTDNESAKRLGDRAADAERKIGIHGVSASAATPQPGESVGSRATRSEVEKLFPVHNTPTRTDPLHRTIELPKPVTNRVARLFNWLFKKAL